MGGKLIRSRGRGHPLAAGKRGRVVYRLGARRSAGGGKAKFGLAVAGTLSLLASGGALFIGSGVYDIGADDHHTKVVLSLIEQLREHSIELRARTIDLRYSEAPQRIAAGAERYAALCAGCHLAPGVMKSEIRPISIRTRRTLRRKISATVGGHSG